MLGLPDTFQFPEAVKLDEKTGEEIRKKSGDRWYTGGTVEWDFDENHNLAQKRYARGNNITVAGNGMSPAVTHAVVKPLYDMLRGAENGTDYMDAENDRLDASYIESSDIRFSVQVKADGTGSDNNAEVLKNLENVLTVPKNMQELSRTNPTAFIDWLRKNAWSESNPNGRYEVTFRTMQVIGENNDLYPPMATIDTNGEMGSHSTLFQWEAAVNDRDQEVRDLLDSTINGRAVWKKIGWNEWKPEGYQPVMKKSEFASQYGYRGKELSTRYNEYKNALTESNNKLKSERAELPSQFKPDGYKAMLKKTDYGKRHNLEDKALDEAYLEYKLEIEDNNRKAWERWANNPNALDDLEANGYACSYKLVKRPGDSLYARYNSYVHSSNEVLNDQFSGAYDRENLQVVLCVVPHSEDGIHYQAKYAKDPTGWAEWKSGDVAGQVAANAGEERKVFLSRWLMPVMVLDNDYVARLYADIIHSADADVRVPANTLSPQLLESLEKIIPENISYARTAPSKDHPNGTYKNSYIERLRNKIQKGEGGPERVAQYQKMLDHALEMEQNESDD